MGGYRSFFARLLDAAVRRIEYELSRGVVVRRRRGGARRDSDKPRGGE